MNNGSPLFTAALILYVLSAALYHTRSLVAHQRPARLAQALALCGVAAQSLAIIQRTVVLGHAPYLELPEALATVSWALVVLTLVAERRKHTTVLGGLAMPMAVAILFVADLMPSGGGGVLVPLMHERGWTAHVGAIVMAFGALTLAFCAAVLYLLQEKKLKEKKMLPRDGGGLSLAEIEQTANWLAAFGFSMLTLGLLMGGLWASSGAWHGRWYAQPIVLATLATWAVYAAYLFQRSVRGERGRANMYLLITGFTFATATVLLIRLLLPGQHRF